METLPKLLKRADYICSILPKTPKTTGILGKDILQNCQGDKKFLFQKHPCSLSINPRGRPTVTVDSDHYFHTSCLFVRPFSLFKVKKLLTTEGTVGLAEWIIVDIRLVQFIFFRCQIHQHW